MSKNKLKIQAFTLLELMVVLILSGIMLAILYQTFHIMQAYYHNFEQEREELTKMEQMHFRFKKDFQDSRMVMLHDQTMVCIFDQKNITYTFTDTYILRNQAAHIDTFFCAPYDLQYHFLDDQGSTADPLLDRVSWKQNYKEETLYFDALKTYSADVLVSEAYQEALKTND